jgi:D-alanyl-D-alanine carboxypeptidase/D-alanyl-D-alanine-endopeptidase (penicillin-binding protein 4)
MRLGLASRRLLSIALGLLVLTFLYGCQEAGEQGGSESTGQTRNSDSNEAQAALGSEVEKIMDSSFYEYGEWGYLEVDPSDGTTVRALGPPDRLYIPGSSTKLFSVSATLDDLGFDHRFETPVYAQGEVKDGTLSGDLILVASGDLTMGGRTTKDGTVAFTDIDHTYANDVPGATLTPENPLAGLDEIAEQVYKSGITHVDGDVVIDDRLFDLAPSGEPNPNLDPWPNPITINDNLIDVEITPGEVGEAPESVTWRPHVAPYQIDVQAKTVAAGEPNTVSVSAGSDDHIVVSGNIASDAGTLLRVAHVEDPASFARTALIEALERAGVSVSASPTGSNPASDLPEKDSYKSNAKVATYESPPFSEYAKLILKVSHNYGANLNVCLMAVKAGSTDCNDGFPVMKSFFEKAGVDTSQVALADGRGGNPSDRFTPQAATEVLHYWLEQPQADTFRTMLPEMGVNGSLAKGCDGCSSAKGKIFAKPGTTALPDLVNGRLTQAESLGGYMEAESGQYHVFFLVVNGATVQDIEDAIKVIDDLNYISAVLQEDASQQGEES